MAFLYFIGLILCVWRAEDSLMCSSSSPTLLERVSVCHCILQASWPPRSPNAPRIPISTSHLTAGMLGLQVCATMVAFHGPQIQAEVRVLV